MLFLRQELSLYMFAYGLHWFTSQKPKNSPKMPYLLVFNFFDCYLLSFLKQIYGCLCCKKRLLFALQNAYI